MILFWLIVIMGFVLFAIITFGMMLSSGANPCAGCSNHNCEYCLCARSD